MTYVNSSCFALLLLPILIRHVATSDGASQAFFRKRGEPVKYTPLPEGDSNVFRGRTDEEESAVRNGYITDASEPSGSGVDTPATDIESGLDIRETAWLSFEFSMIWVRS